MFNLLVEASKSENGEFEYESNFSHKAEFKIFGSGCSKYESENKQELIEAKTGLGTSCQLLRVTNVWKKQNSDQFPGIFKVL